MHLSGPSYFPSQTKILLSYSFGVIQAGNGETTPVECTAFLASDGLGTLPPVTDGTCKESSRTWTVEKVEDGSLTLTVTQQVTPSSFQSGYHAIGSDEIVLEQTGASQQQRYTGPAEFDLLTSL